MSRIARRRSPSRNDGSHRRHVAGKLQTGQVRTATDDPALRQLDPGERAAILLAQQEAGALLLIDDAAGRSEATRRGIPSTGTLGILRAAAIRQLLDLPTSLKNLAATNFRVSQRLIVELLAEDTARKQHLDP